MNSLDLRARKRAIRESCFLPTALMELLLTYVTIDCCVDYTFRLEDGAVPLACIDGDCYHVHRLNHNPDQRYLMCNSKSTGIESSILDRVMKLNDKEILVASLNEFHIWNRETGDIHTTLDARLACVFRGCVYYVHGDQLMCEGHVLISDDVRYIEVYGDCLNIVDSKCGNRIYCESFPIRDCISMYKWSNRCFIVTRNSLEVDDWYYYLEYVCRVIAFDHLLLVQCAKCFVVWDLVTLCVTPIQMPHDILSESKLCFYDDSTVTVLK